MIWGQRMKSATSTPLPRHTRSLQHAHSARPSAEESCHRRAPAESALPSCAGLPTRHPRRSSLRSRCPQSGSAQCRGDRPPPPNAAPTNRGGQTRCSPQRSTTRATRRDCHRGRRPNMGAAQTGLTFEAHSAWRWLAHAAAWAWMRSCVCLPPSCATRTRRWRWRWRRWRPKLAGALHSQRSRCARRRRATARARQWAGRHARYSSALATHAEI